MINRNGLLLFGLILTISGCRENTTKSTDGEKQPDVINYSIASPTTKILPDRFSKSEQLLPHFSLAKGEYQSLQIVIDTSSIVRKNFQVKSKAPFNDKASLENAVEIRLVGYVKTVDEKRWKWQKPEDIGWWPDPLLPNKLFDIPANWKQSIWVTIHAPKDAISGDYELEVTIESNTGSVKIPFKVNIWDFKIAQNSMHNIAWMPPDKLQTYYVGNQNVFSKEFVDMYKNWADFAFDHGMPPAADMLCGWTDEDISWPVQTINGKLDFTLFDELLDYGLERNMKEFIIAIFPRRKTFEMLNETQKIKMEDYLTTTYQHLKEKGVAHMAVVYNIDEPPKELFESCRKNYNYVKSVIPECKVYQCVNNIEGVEALEGYADIWDVYIPQYPKTNLAEKKDKEVRWSVCIWPHESPNLFTEYNGMDPRIIGWLMYKYEIKGFEYWSYFHSWKENMGNNLIDWQSRSTLTSWKKGRFTEGDGLLAYPGPNKMPLSSIRLENLRDGFEDYQLLLSTESLKGKNAGNDIVDKIVYDLSNWETSPILMQNVRMEIRDALSKR